nr:hypothetical protein orf221 [uncultured bacterium]
MKTLRRRVAKSLKLWVRRWGAFVLFRLITPCDPVGMRKVRVGNPGRKGMNGDGGYVMADDFGRIAAALSIGVGSEVSWDLDIAGRGIAVHQFDHTVERPPVEHPRFNFNRVGIAAADSADGVMLSLDSILSGLGVGGDLLLQVDCEGAEWAALESASPKTMARFAQIVIEAHDPLRLVPYFTPRRFIGWVRNLLVLRRLAKTHQVIHAHANNYDRTLNVRGIQVPVVVELSYLRRDLARFAPSAGPSPGPLDASNSDGADIPIGALLAQR